jgi:O-antigen ligase
VSASSRSQLALHSLDMFGERPLTGHGVGATVEWREPESTHNIYLRQLAEYGLAGAWLAPALVLIAFGVTRPTRSPSVHDPDRIIQRSARVFACFVALWGLFSHNVLDDAFILIGIALVAGGIPDDAPRAAIPGEATA